MPVSGVQLSRLFKNFNLYYKIRNGSKKHNNFVTLVNMIAME